MKEIEEEEWKERTEQKKKEFSCVTYMCQLSSSTVNINTRTRIENNKNGKMFMPVIFLPTFFK